MAVFCDESGFLRVNFRWAKLGVLAVILGVFGCSNNNAQSTSSSSVSQKSSQAKVSTGTSGESEGAVVAALQKNLDTAEIKAKVISAVPTEMPNMYWVTADGFPPFFSDKNGEFIIQGQIVKLGGKSPVDLSGQLASQGAKQTLAAVDKKDMIIFPAKGETKGVIYAFTDPLCGYCQRLHQEVPELNQAGVEVRYLAWPRSAEIVPLSKAIWCSPDRNAALTAAKNGQHVDALTCDDPVEKQMAIGHSLGVRGTPAVFTEEGEQIGGYLPVPEILKALKIS